MQPHQHAPSHTTNWEILVPVIVWGGGLQHPGRSSPSSMNIHILYEHSYLIKTFIFYIIIALIDLRPKFNSFILLTFHTQIPYNVTPIIKALGLKNLQNSVLLKEKVPFWEYFCPMSVSTSHRIVFSPFFPVLLPETSPWFYTCSSNSWEKGRGQTWRWTDCGSNPSLDTC